jgi:mono/diheme cytochrome c family protein
MHRGMLSRAAIFPHTGANFKPASHAWRCRCLTGTTKSSKTAEKLRQAFPAADLIFPGAVMWKGFVMGVVVTIIVAAAVVWLVVQEGLLPAATLAREAPKGRNPAPLTEDNLIEGIKLYSLNCVICHGTAKGNAGAARLPKANTRRRPSSPPAVSRTIHRAGPSERSRTESAGRECPPRRAN